MILWLFCINIFYEFTCKIDTNHNGIYFGMVSPQWSCDMMLALCVNEFESIRVSFTVWNVGDQT